MAAGGFVGLRLCHYSARDMDRSLAVFWPEPDLAPELEPQGGTVLVQTVYSITAERKTEFFEAMARVSRSRMRTGATEWGLFRGGARPQPSSRSSSCQHGKHLRQHHERLTGTDRQFEEAGDALSDPPPGTLHAAAVRVPD
jgi:Transmembrane secretion effector